VVFFPEGAFGPTNNCVGIGDVLRRRGHRVVFVVEESFAGTLEARGFEEARMRLQPPPQTPEEPETPQTPEEPGQFWKDFVRDTAPELRKSTLEQLEGFVLPVWEGLVAGAEFVDERLREILDEVRPDVIVEDNVVGFPAVVTAGVPWARIASCNPLEMKDPDLPPPFSGYPTADRTGWDRFRHRYLETHGDLWKGFDAFCRDRGAPGLPEGEFIWESPHLNLYLYPEAADYRRSRPLAGTWHRLGSCVRDTDDAYEVPAHLRRGGEGSALVYLSLGSLGSADVELMTRLIDALAATRHRVVVSMGPQHEQLDLAPNMNGAEFLPQPAILPQVDLVITHGGNNTTTESLHFGRPMVVLPLFWDQHDNAQRMDELGLGVRLRTYQAEPAELTGAIDRLLADRGLRDRLARISAGLRSSPGTVRAADLIERLASDR
jgi:MGT family glycosyltransferase